MEKGKSKGEKLAPFDGFVKSLLDRHPGEGRGPDIVPAQAGNYSILMNSCFHRKPWIPAFAGMTKSRIFILFTKSSLFAMIINLAL
jgi:hypothetical protein